MAFTKNLMGLGLPAALSSSIGDVLVDTITAHAGGGQGSATALTGTMNIVTTCATTADSALLPDIATVPTGRIQVTNLGAAACSVYPFGSSQTINALSSATAFSVPAGKTCQFYVRTTTKWVTLLGA